MEAEIARKNAVCKALELPYWRDSKVIGIGTGRTVTMLLSLMPRGFLENKVFVASSLDTLLRLKTLGARVLDPSSVCRLDMYIDSADAFDEKARLVKGGGAALSMEKILAFASKRFIVVVEEEKLVKNILSVRIPVEVRKEAISIVAEVLREKGLKPEIREAQKGKRGPIITDLGGIIIDIDASMWNDTPEKLDRFLKSIPGVVETGLFIDMATDIVVGYRDNAVHRRLRG